MSEFRTKKENDKIKKKPVKSKHFEKGQKIDLVLHDPVLMAFFAQSTRLIINGKRYRLIEEE